MWCQASEEGSSQGAKIITLPTVKVHTFPLIKTIKS